MTTPGGMDVVATVSLISVCISLAAVLIVQLRKVPRRNPRHDPSDQHICGDCFPHPVVRGEFKSNSHNGGVSNP